MEFISPAHQRAVEDEAHLRDVAYLDQPWTICGIAIRQLTPYLWGELRTMKSPFLYGGSFDYPHIMQFIKALAVEWPASRVVRKGLFGKRIQSPEERVSFAVAYFTLDQCAKEIEEYLECMFMDAPGGGKPKEVDGKASIKTPIASPVAWLCYRFKSEPWDQPREVTQHIPLPILYQELRCWQAEHGETPINASQKFIGDKLALLNAARERGEITAEQIDAGYITASIKEILEAQHG